MLDKKKNHLDPPPISKEDGAHEIMRVWGGPNLPVQTILNATWEDPAAWGLLLVDIGRHVSKVYAQNGWSEKEALKRIKQGFDAEWQYPSDDPEIEA